MGILKAILRFITGYTLNTDIAHSVKECRDLFAKAKKSIHIVAGDLEAGVFENKEIIKVLRECANRKGKPVSIQIMCGPKPDPKTKSLFKLSRSSPNLKMLKLSNRPSGHFIVVDNKHTRVEEYHDQFTPERKAYIALNTLFLADRLETEFFELKSQAVNTK